jgi:hypothetical protein
MIRPGRTVVTLDEINFMTDEEYAAMQRQYGGGYVVRRGAEVLVNARSYGDLIDQADAKSINWKEVVIQYVDRADVLRVI